MTPHLEAASGDYAEAVLLAGDPDRVAFIAKTMLENARCINRVRGALGFTGFHRGNRVSVQTSGMGHGSFAIYANELVTFYGVKTLIRVGSCGSLTPEIGLREVVVSERAVTDQVSGGSTFGTVEHGIPADAGLLELTRHLAPEIGCPVHWGLTGASDYYYHPLGLARMSGLMADRAIAIDMETHALYALGERLGIRALSICTVVDSLVAGDMIERAERQAVFAPMARLALDVVAHATA